MKKVFPFLGFNSRYLLAFLGLFGLEIFIAKYVHDTFVRPFLGDALVVVLLFCFCKIFINNYSKWVVLGVFLFACLIETLQAFQFVDRFGLRSYKILTIALGSTFDVLDLFAYLLGALFCYGFLKTQNEI
jgi:hypothetical protein